MATRRLTVYLMQDDVLEFADARDAEKHATEAALSSASGLDGIFYRAPSHPRTPGWVGFIEPILSDPIGEVLSSSASALLLVRVQQRIFAFTFGFGRSLLDLSRIEQRFGLKVALNRMNPSQLRSLDTKAFEDLVVTTTTQVSKDAELPSFGVDVSRDILRAATGEPRDKELAKRLSGSDPLVLNLETQAAALGDLCAELLRAHGEETYKDDFGWVDQLMLVRDDAIVAALDDALVNELVSGTVVATHLALPEPISWEELDAFQVGGTRNQEYDDLDLDVYLARLGDGRSEITLDRLKSRRVSVRFARTDRFENRWNLYKCLVSEQRIDDDLYVLIEGRWFSISESLVEEVDTYVAQVSEPRFELPAAKLGESEGDYNERAAKESGGSLLKLDARVKRPGGASSGIELCDLLTTDGEFIHIKRKSRSATLSHLFAQGSVSAATFFSDGVFREAIRQVVRDLPADVVPDESRYAWLDLIPDRNAAVDRQRYCVTYAVVANSRKPGRDWLPFFSKLNLMHQGRRLQAYGYNVALGRVPVESESTGDTQ